MAHFVRRIERMKSMNTVDSADVEMARQIIRETGRASVCALQRRMGIGYVRAARVMEALEWRGDVGPCDGVNARIVYMEVDRDKKDKPI